MKLLLDTHAVLWWLDDPLLLSLTARQAIAEPSNDVLVSAAVCWEIAIKRGLGKLTAPADLRGALQNCGFTELNVTPAHALATETLPMDHRDPFDRMSACEMCTVRSYYCAQECLALPRTAGNHNFHLAFPYNRSSGRGLEIQRRRLWPLL
jgi:PIN domain nuclease of toxin-antitoxin system